MSHESGFATKDQLRFRDLTPEIRIATFVLIGLVFLMATGLVLGIEPEGSNRVAALINGLLGRGDIRSSVWLGTARMATAAIVVLAIWLRRAQAHLRDEVAERKMRDQ